LILEEGSIEGN